MMPFGILTYAYNDNNQNKSAGKQLENSAMLLATSYDFENPLYAREGIIRKIVKTIRRMKK